MLNPFVHQKPALIAEQRLLVKSGLLSMDHSIGDYHTCASLPDPHLSDGEMMIRGGYVLLGTLSIVLCLFVAHMMNENKHLN